MRQWPCGQGWLCVLEGGGWLTEAGTRRSEKTEAGSEGR